MAVAETVSFTEQKERANVLDGSPPPVVIFLLLGVSTALMFVCLYLIWQFWPTTAVLASKDATRVHFFGITRHVSVDVRLFLVVALAGALGGLLHATRSFSWYVGHSSLKWRWLPYYGGVVFVGAGLATIVYVVVRGGIVSGTASTADVNPYGFAAIGAIVGLFSEQALEMLKRVANDFFAGAPQGADQATDPNVQTATSTETKVTTETTTATVATEGTGIAVSAPAVAVADAPTVGASVATVAGVVEPNGDATTYSFEYGTSTTYGTKTEEKQVFGGEPVQVTADVEGLSAGTEYHFRLVAKNSVGEVTSEDKTFVTTTD